MLTRVDFVETTGDSVPFAAAAVSCGFEKIGYVEEEYFITGEANVYGESGTDTPNSIFEGAPYTTRLIVRRPKDAKRFSGNVVLEILNATAGIDIDRMWVNSWPFFTRNGDIYVGITSKGHVVDSLLKFDAKRYAPINWSNPMPERQIPEGAVTTGPFRFLPQFESGLFWDMLTDCAHLLRSQSADNPIRAHQNIRLFLTGWSQSGFYIARYLKSFHDPKSPLFDGYLSAGSGAGHAPLNAYERMRFAFGDKGIPSGSMMGAAQPVIAINTESENRLVNWVGDFDEPHYKFRTYQIAASSHDTKYCLLDYYGEHGREMLNRIGIANGYDAVDGDPLDYPYEVIFNAAFHHLYVWAKEGIPAPKAPKIKTQVVYGKSTDPMGSYIDNCRDSFGNCVGGIRTPAVDFPTGTYSSFSTKEDGTVNPMFGKVNPFKSELITLLYRDASNYRSLVEKGTDQAIAEGFILAEDRDGFIERVVQTAVERGLKP